MAPKRTEAGLSWPVLHSLTYNPGFSRGMKRRHMQKEVALSILLCGSPNAVYFLLCSFTQGGTLPLHLICNEALRALLVRWHAHLVDDFLNSPSKPHILLMTGAAPSLPQLNKHSAQQTHTFSDPSVLSLLVVKRLKLSSRRRCLPTCPSFP